MLTLRKSVFSVGTGTVHLLCGEGTPDGSPASPGAPDRGAIDGWGGAGASTGAAAGERNLRRWLVSGCAASTAGQSATPGPISTVGVTLASASSEMAPGRPTFS